MSSRRVLPNPNRTNDEARLLIAEGTGTSVAALSEALEWIHRHFGSPPFDDCFAPTEEGGRRRWRLLRTWVKLSSVRDPLGTVPTITGWLPELQDAAGPDAAKSLTTCGIALRNAGRFHDSVQLLEHARAGAPTRSAERSATIALATSLRLTGKGGRALRLAEDVAAARRVEYRWQGNLAVLQAELEAVLALEATGRPNLARATALRSARLSRNGLAAAGNASTFGAVGRTLLALGHPFPALANARVAILITERFSVAHHIHADARLTAADAALALAAAGDGDQFRAAAASHATAAVSALRHAFGPDHEAVLSAASHPALRARTTPNRPAIRR